MNLLLFGAPGTGKGTQADFLISRYQLCHISTGDLFRKALSEKTPLGLKARSYMDRGKLVPDSLVISMIEAELASLFWKNTKKNAKKNTKKPVNGEDARKVLPVKKALKKGSYARSGGTSYRGFILDGFPRTLSQAEALDSLLNALKLKLDKVLLLNVPELVLTERITGRRVAKTSGCVYHIKFNPPRKTGVCDKTGEPLMHRKDDTEEVIKERFKAYNEQTFPLIEYYRKKSILCELDGCGSPKEVFLRIKEGLTKP